MMIHEALLLLDTVLKPEHLSDVQELVFRHVWEGQTYEEIAQNYSYDTDYIKHVGCQLWQYLSKAFGQKVTKSNIRAVLRGKAQQIQVVSQASPTSGSMKKLKLGALGVPEIKDGGPLTATLENPEGQVPLGSIFYVGRPPIETDCYKAISNPGALIRIKAPRQMGKSSLMLRILNHAIEQGCRATSLNLQSAGGQVLSSVDQFLRWFCARIARKLNLPDQVADYWQEALSSNDKCTDYFELYLLPQLNGSLTLCLDEVDELFKHPAIASDFFGLLRSWHEESKINPVWQNLRLVITHSKEVYIPLNINQSPFNVGIPIELPQLNREQVADLVERHRLDWTENEIDSLMAMVGGHPYLLRVALYHIARSAITLEQLLQIAPTEEWVYAEHLRRHLLNLEDSNLATVMKQVVAATEPVRIRAVDAFKLSSMGLVRFQGNDVVPLCNLYRLYFRERLGVTS